jgi:hypothetical protein
VDRRLNLPERLIGLAVIAAIRPLLQGGARVVDGMQSHTTLF